MSIFDAADDVWRDRALSLLRVAAACIFVPHGLQKLFAYPPSGPGMHPVHLASLAGVAGVLETFGGLLILFGLCTRPVAFLLSGEMAVAYFLSHAPRGVWPILNHGELAVVLCFTFLYLSAAGGGAWSLDRLLLSRGRRGSVAPVAAELHSPLA